MLVKTSTNGQFHLYKSTSRHWSNVMVGPNFLTVLITHKHAVIWSGVLCTSSRGDSGGQTGTRWNSRLASLAGRSRCGSLHSASPSSPEAPPPSGALGFLGSCSLWKLRQNKFHKHVKETRPKSHRSEQLTLLCLLLLLFDLISYNGQFSLKLGWCGMSTSKFIECLPGALKGADKTLLQVRAHPGETLLQLWNRDTLQITNDV